MALSRTQLRQYVTLSHQTLEAMTENGRRALAACFVGLGYSLFRHSTDDEPECSHEEAREQCIAAIDGARHGYEHRNEADS